MSLFRKAWLLSVLTLLSAQGLAHDLAQDPAQDQVDEDLSRLRKAFDHPLPGPRLEAAQAVAKYGAKAIPFLEAVLQSGTAHARRAATDAANAMRKQAAPLQGALRRVLSDKHAWVRAGAAQALGVIGPLPDKTVAALAESAGDPDLFVRINSMQTLSKRRVTQNKKLLVAAAVSALRAKDSGWAAKRFAVDLLRRHGKKHRAAIPALLEVLQNNPQGMWDQSEQVARLLIGMGQSKSVLKVLSVRLQHPEHGGFKSTLKVVGHLGKQVQPLRPQVAAIAENSNNRDHRKVALQALDQLTGN